MKTTIKKSATKKASGDKPTKIDRVKGRISKLESILEKYESKRAKRHEKLAALKTLLAQLSKKS